MGNSEESLCFEFFGKKELTREEILKHPLYNEAKGFWVSPDGLKAIKEGLRRS